MFFAVCLSVFRKIRDVISNISWSLLSASISLPHQSYLPTPYNVSLSSYVGGGMRKTWRVLAKKPEENRPFETPRHGWEYNIKTDVKETG